MLKSLATVAIVLVALTVTAKAEADETFKATLTGDQEVPPVGPVTTDMTGRVKIQINKTETEGEFTLIVNEAVEPTRSQNITVSWRRSAPVASGAGGRAPEERVASTAGEGSGAAPAATSPSLVGGRGLVELKVSGATAAPVVLRPCSQRHLPRGPRVCRPRPGSRRPRRWQAA
jgi:hypothetical protein